MVRRIKNGCSHALFLTLICWEAGAIFGRGPEGPGQPGVSPVALTGVSRSELIPHGWIESLGSAVRSTGSDEIVSRAASNIAVFT